MANCLNPKIAYVCGKTVARDGVISDNLVFSFRSAVDYFCKITGDSVSASELAMSSERSIPCGKCAYCQIVKRKDMTTRLSHELSMHQNCCFITLTYDDHHLPLTDAQSWKDGRARNEFKTIYTQSENDWGTPTLVPRHVQLFIKRLRRHLEYQPTKDSSDVRDHVTSSIRFFAVGEYGSKSSRPHYHILLFGWKPSDMRTWEIKRSDRGEVYRICRSSQIEKLWKYGFSTVADVNYGVARYCARYVTKKYARLTGFNADMTICPEFTLQSVRNGGMGAPWVDRYCDHLKRGLVAVRSGKDRISQCAIPRYYLSRLRKTKRELWLDIREQRIEFATSAAPRPFEELQNVVMEHILIDKYQLKKEQI